MAFTPQVCVFAYPDACHEVDGKSLAGDPVKVILVLFNLFDLLAVIHIRIPLFVLYVSAFSACYIRRYATSTPLIVIIYIIITTNSNIR